MCLHVYRVVPNTPPFDIQSRTKYEWFVIFEGEAAGMASIAKRGNCSDYDRKRCAGFGE